MHQEFWNNTPLIKEDVMAKDFFKRIERAIPMYSSIAVECRWISFFSNMYIEVMYKTTVFCSNKPTNKKHALYESTLRRLQSHTAFRLGFI